MSASAANLSPQCACVGGGDHCLALSLVQKRLRFALDLSQSMTRGNAWDHRLDRMADVAILVMESLAGFEHKFSYVLLQWCAAAYVRAPLLHAVFSICKLCSVSVSTTQLILDVMRVLCALGGVETSGTASSGTRVALRVSRWWSLASHQRHQRNAWK